MDGITAAGSSSINTTSRRQFLKGLGAGALATVLPNLPLGNDSFGRAAAAEPKKTVDVKKDLRPSDFATLDEYFNAVIDRETAKGTLKSQESFKKQDSRGMEIYDIVKYKAYREGIVDGAKQFENPNDLESFLNGINHLYGNNKNKVLFLDETGVEGLVSSADYKKAFDALQRIYAKAVNKEPESEIKVFARDLITALKDGTYPSSVASVR